MSATIPNATNNRLSTTSLTGVSAANTFLLMAWVWRANVDATLAQTWALEVNQSGASDTNPRARLLTLFSGGLLDRGRIDNSTAGGQNTTIEAWTHLALWYGGWNNSSQLVRLYRNGSASGNDANVSLNFPSISLGALTVFDRASGGGGGGHWRGRIAEVAIYSNISTGQRDSIISEAQTRHVGALTIAPNFSWRLLDNANATVGAVNLNQTGTVTFDSSNHPPVGDGAAVTGRFRSTFIM